MAGTNVDYSQLPAAIKDNLSEEQWAFARHEIIQDGQRIPESTAYINVRNGCCQDYEIGEIADGPLLATHNLSGGRGRDSSQFFTAPDGAHLDEGPAM